MTDVMSPADIAACCGNRDNDGILGGGGIIGLIALVIVGSMFGFGGFGGFGGGMNGILPWLFLNGGGGFGGFGGNAAIATNALTRNDLCSEFNFNNLENSVRSVQAAVDASARNTDNAICQLGYNDAQLANGIQMQIANEARTSDNAVCQLGYNTQQGFNNTQQIITNQGYESRLATQALASQVDNCCCGIKGEIKDNTIQGVMNTNTLQQQLNQLGHANDMNWQQNRYEAQQYNCNLMQAIDKLGDRIDARFNAQDIAARDAKIHEQEQMIANLVNKNNMSTAATEIRTGIINDLSRCPVGTYNVPNPNCCYGPWGANNWAGFTNNSGCGCAA